MKSGNLNFLEPSGTLQAYNGTVLTLPLVRNMRILMVALSVYKRKAVPLQAWSGPEGSRKLKFADYMTTAQDGGKFVSLTHRPPLPPGNVPGTHYC